ncbi:MAG: isochorismatase family protein [Hyphomonadaceae bacterium]|nr:isochorismatase family protein [Hyphomonadaceae bacterium]
MKALLTSLALAAVLAAAPTAAEAQPRRGAPPQAAVNYTEKLTRENATFVLVDFLTGFTPGIQTIEPRTFRANAAAFARTSQIFNMPTIMLGDEGGFRGNFMPEVVQFTGHAVRIERHTVSAWAEPRFRAEIERIGRRKIVMGGPSIDICTLQLALDMRAAGYEVYVVVDASGSDTVQNETAAIERLVQAGVVVTNWGSIASEIMSDWQSPEGAAVGQLYQDYSAWGRRF